MRLRRLVLEAHRRSLWQVLGIYLVASWVGYQVVLALAAGIGLPEWVPAFAIVLFVIGLPIVVATAFVQEGVPGLRGDPTLLPGLEQDGPMDWASPPAPAARRPALTWRRTLGAGFAAFLVLSLSASGYMGLRAAGIGPFATMISRGDLDARDRLILADFTAVGAEPAAFAEAVTEALRIDLEQSRAFSLAQPAFVTEALRRAQRDPAAALTEELAREIAQREGIKAVIAGDVARVGGHFVLTARVVGADGATLVSVRETAADSAAILTSLDRLARRLRERIGESLRSIQSTEPLETVTTGSLEALRKYSRAARLLRYTPDDADRAVLLLQDAIALDSTFAMAWLVLGTAFRNYSLNRDREEEAYTRAFENRDRLSERERQSATATYYSRVLRDRERAVAAYEWLIEQYPDVYSAVNNLGVLYAEMRDFDGAAGMYQRALEFDSMAAVPNSNLVIALYNADRPTEAVAALERYRARLPGDPAYHWLHGLVAWGQGEHRTALRHLERYRQEVSIQGRRARVHAEMAHMYSALGQVNEAERQYGEALALSQRIAVTPTVLVAVRRARMGLHVLRQPAQRALEPLDELLRNRPLDDLPPLDRPYTAVAGAYAAAGHTDRARALLAEFESVLPRVAESERGSIIAVEGEIAIAEGRPLEAVALFHEAYRNSTCRLCYMADIGYAFDAAALPDSAIAWYERFLGVQDFFLRGPEDGIWRGHVLERLGVLHADRGDARQAARYTAEFIALWQDADPALRPRIDNASDRLRLLLREGGPGAGRQ